MMARRSVYFKNFIHVVFLLFLSFMVLGTAFLAMSYRFILQTRVKTMERNAESAGKMIAACIEEWGSAAELEVRVMLQWMNETTGFHILLTSGEGEVVACSDVPGTCSHLGKTVPQKVVSSINRQGRYAGLGKLGGVFERERYMVGVPLPSTRWTGSGYGCVILSGNTEEMTGSWRHFFGIFLATVVVVVALALVLTLITTGRQTRPIKEMARAAERFGRGDFTARVDPDGREDEIGELMESFNAMADSLERSEKSRRELIANVSHELKTPMTTITGFADGILDGTVPPEREKEYLAVISSEAKRLSRLVRGMLDMSQIQEADARTLAGKSFDVGELICQALLSLERKITDRGLDVEPRLPEEPIHALGDKDAITQVVYNLIDNAAKFAAPGTSIVISLWKEEKRAFVSVENKGDTIPKEELPLIFERFHKTDRSRSEDRDGVGLGLYIVKTILDSHGENIYVTSKDGTTRFVFTLKLAGPTTPRGGVVTKSSRNSPKDS